MSYYQLSSLQMSGIVFTLGFSMVSRSLKCRSIQAFTELPVHLSGWLLSQHAGVLSELIIIRDDVMTSRTCAWKDSTV